MTYYELVTYLETLVEKAEITQNDIDYINNKDISLPSSRYIRFIGQINYLLSERLRLAKNKILDRLAEEYMDSGNLVLLLDPFKREYDYFNIILNIKYIKDENKNAYLESYVLENNKIVDNIKEYFDKDDERIDIINSYYMEVK